MIDLKFTPSKGFRKWDAGDELLLSEDITGTTLVINDCYGAISCSLKGEVYSYTPSYTSRIQIEETATLNNSEIEIIKGIDELPDSVDNIVLKLPKSLELMEFYLNILGQKYKGARYYATGMVKYMPISMVRLTEKYFANVKTSLAKKKARLIYGEVAHNFSREFPLHFNIEDKTIVSYPGVFSQNSLDIGTRFLLPYIPKGVDGNIIDLGCGSGVIGLFAKINNPESKVYLTDESELAVKSSGDTFAANGLEGFPLLGDKLKGFDSNFADLILCNPPFHSGTRVLTDIAVQMFKDSKRVLKKGGRVIIIANRHLGYHKHLRSIFHNMKILDSNEKFNIYSSYKR